MQSDTISTLTTRVGTLQADISDLRRAVDLEELTVSDRQYLSRCFDLLDMELSALRDFLTGLRA